MLLLNSPACPTAQQYNRHNGFSPCYVPLALCEQGDKGAGLHPCSGFLRPTSGADTGPLHFRQGVMLSPETVTHRQQNSKRILLVRNIRSGR